MTNNVFFAADMSGRILAAIVESSDDAIISKDLEGVIRSWNRGAERIFGYSAEETIGQPVTMLMPPDRVNEEPAILERIRRGERIEHYETVRRRKDGTHIDVSLTVSPILDVDGRVVGASKIARDITDRNRSEDSLIASEERRRLALDAAGMGSFIWYPDDDRGVPDERMLALFGLPPDGVLNLATALASRIHPDDTERYALAVGRAVDPDGDSELYEELRVLHPDGAERWVAVSARVAFVGQPSHVDRMAGVAFDITGRMQAAAEREVLLAAAVDARETAEEASRAREEFLSIASHELRNPVAALQGTAQLLRRARASGRLTEERLDRYLEALEASAMHLATLTDDLLDVSRLERGEMPLHLAPADFSSIVRELVRHGEWGDGRFVLEGDQTLAVVIDEQRIRQVVSNLLDNAVKYSSGEESVRVRLAPSGDGVLLEVEDTGIGLPTDSLEAIFTPFGRAPNAAEANIPGLGLGLYLARRIVEQHGGRLWAQSEGEDRGTVMSLWLPNDERAGGMATGR